mgnify:CR=1 FL=1
MRKTRTSSYIIVFVIIIILGIIIAVCNLPSNANTQYSPEEAEEILNNASTIEVRQKFSIGKYYEIYVNDEMIATVQGKAVHLLGDTFTMYSSDGSVMGSEQEEILHLNNQAVFRDKDGKEVFHMSSKLISIGIKLDLFDTNGELIGKSEQEVLHLLRKDNYYNSMGELIYQSNKNLSIMGSYNIDRVSDNEDTLGAKNVVFLNCIEDALDSSNSSNNNNNSTSN